MHAVLEVGSNELIFQ